MLELHKSKNSLDKSSDLKISSKNMQSDMNIILPEENNKIKDISKSKDNSINNKLNKITITI